MSDLPIAEEMERGVIGAILAQSAYGDNRHIIDEAIRFGLNTEWFHDIRLKAMWDIMVTRHANGDSTDQFYLCEQAKTKADLGGVAFIAELPDSAVPSMIKHYLTECKEAYLRRFIINQADQMKQAAYSGGKEASEIVDAAESKIFSLRGAVAAKEDVSYKSTIVEVVTNLEAAYNSNGIMMGLSTGIRSLDEVYCGLTNCALYVLAARPSMGKSSLALNIAEHHAMLGNWVAFFSFEMKRQELVTRSLCTAGRVDSRAIRMGRLTEDDMVRLAKASKRLMASKLHIEDNAEMNIMELRAEARRLKRDLNIKLIVVDYLQLIRSDNKAHHGNAEVEHITRQLKLMAMELCIPVIALSQMNREFEKDRDGNGQGRPPKMSDLRGSGSIEQDADSIAFLYCPDQTKYINGMLCVTCSIQKNRGVATGDVPLLFDKTYTRFEAMPRYTKDDFDDREVPNVPQTKMLDLNDKLAGA